MQEHSKFDFHLETKGLLMAYKTSQAEKEEAEVVAQAKDLGLKIDHLSTKEVLKKQPQAPMDIAGTIGMKAMLAAHQVFMENMIGVLKDAGVNFLLEKEVSILKLKGVALHQYALCKKRFNQMRLS